MASYASHDDQSQRGKKVEQVGEMEENSEEERGRERSCKGWCLLQGGKERIKWHV